MQTDNFTFSQILYFIENGYPVRRASDPVGEFTYRQIPATIAQDVIPKMTSVPDLVKGLMAKRGVSFSYHNQIVKVAADGKTTYRNFSHADLMARDWEIVSE